MNPLNRMNPGSSKAMNNGGYIVTPVDTCMKDGCEKTNDGTGSGYCSYECYATVEGTYRSSEPYTGNGYSVAINPLLEEPATIDEHVALIRARGASLERWTRKDIANQGPIIREIIARMEGDLQSLRTLVKDMEAAGE